MKAFRFKDIGKIHLDFTDRPSASFLTPTRNRSKIAHYIDEADAPSVLMPDDPITFDLNHQKQRLLENISKSKVNTFNNQSKNFKILTS